MNTDIQKRIKSVTFVDANGCWKRPEDMYRMPNGYDRISVQGRRDYLHRWAYIAWHGAIPGGKEVNHLCRQRDCGNPAHLQLATHRENLLHGNTIVSANAAIVRCRRGGHPYSPENTRIRRGKRECRTCPRELKRIKK